jgi:hypothetical protein
VSDQHDPDTEVHTAVLTADNTDYIDSTDNIDSTDDTGAADGRAVDADLDPGAYQLNLDRCVVEVSLRLAGFTVARARLRAVGGVLTTADVPLVAEIEVRVAARPIRVNLPLLGRYLNRSVPRRLKLRFSAAGIDAAGQPPWVARQPAALASELVAESQTDVGSDSGPDADDTGGGWSLPLTARFVRFDQRTAALAVRGPARPPLSTHSFLRSRMWVEAAAEFNR